MLMALDYILKDEEEPEKMGFLLDCSLLQYFQNHRRPKKRKAPEPEKFPFKPEINKNSLALIKKKQKDRGRSSRQEELEKIRLQSEVTPPLCPQPKPSYKD